MTMSCLITAIMLLALIQSQYVQCVKVTKSYDEYAHLQCSACEVLASQVHERLENVPQYKLDSSVKNFQKEKGSMRRSYVGSELQAVEVLDKVCSKLTQCDHFEHLGNRTRFFMIPPEGLSSDVLIRGLTRFDKYEEDYFEVLAPFRACKEICLDIINEREEEITEVIQNNAQVSSSVFTKEFCGEKGAMMCSNTEKIEESLRIEDGRRQIWMRKRAAEDAAKKVAEEKAEAAKILAEEQAKLAAEKEAEIAAESSENQAVNEETDNGMGEQEL